MQQSGFSYQVVDDNDILWYFTSQKAQIKAEAISDCGYTGFYCQHDQVVV